ncbi:MAG TPA: hypothetical protein VFC99_05795 [Acidimicrobiia bacterium]|nr:hypothetical protein [Acidimicrobiia bacterium]
MPGPLTVSITVTDDCVRLVGCGRDGEVREWEYRSELAQRMLCEGLAKLLDLAQLATIFGPVSS